MTTTGNDTPAETRHIYFVSVQFFHHGGIAFTNLEVPLTTELTSLTEVQDIEQYLRTQGFTDGLVMGFTLLRIERVPVTGGPRS